MATPHLDTKRNILVAAADAAVLDSLSDLLTLHGFNVSSVADGTLFLTAVRARCLDCVVVDMCMPDAHGLDLLKEIDAGNFPVPVIAMSGRGNTPLVVKAVKCGAAGYIETPIQAGEAIACIEEAIQSWTPRNRVTLIPDIMADRVDGGGLLTPREHQVLEDVINGASNKQIGRHLGISPRTAELYRARILSKLKARNTADLIRKVLTEVQRPFPEALAAD